MKRSLLRLVPVLLAASLGWISCTHTSPPGAHELQLHVYRVGTVEYTRKVASFRISLEQARARVAEFVRPSPGTANATPVFTGEHAVIIGDSYHFFLPRKQGGVPWAGYYVDGHSGEVAFRTQPGEVPLTNQP